MRKKVCLGCGGIYLFIFYYFFYSDMDWIRLQKTLDLSSETVPAWEVWCLPGLTPPPIYNLSSWWEWNEVKHTRKPSHPPNINPIEPLGKIPEFCLFPLSVLRHQAKTEKKVHPSIELMPHTLYVGFICYLSSVPKLYSLKNLFL